jgi:hypothetical protein
MNVYLGSNLIENTSGVIQAGNNDLIHVEIGSDGQLLLSVHVVSAEGATWARLRRNAWVTAHPEFEITTNPKDLSLIHRPSGATVLRAAATDLNTVEIQKARLHTGTGHAFQVEPEGIAAVVKDGEPIFVLDRCIISGSKTAIVIGADGRIGIANS